MGDCRIERGQHEVSYTEEAQTSDCIGRIVGAQDQQEDLDDVMVALEVAQKRVSAEDLDDDVRQLLLPAVELLVRFCV